MSGGRPARSAKVASARQMYSAARSNMYVVPRTMGAVAVTERKYYDNFKDFTIPASADWSATEADPTQGTLFAPVTGNDIANRIGRKVNVVKLTVRGSISTAAQINQTAADVQGDVRVILFMDQQTNATQAQGEQLMISPSASAIIAVNGFQNYANFGRFRVLKDKTFRFPQPAMTWDGTNVEQAGVTVPFKWTIKFKQPITVHYNGTDGGTFADIVDNSFHILANCTQVDMAPHLVYTCRTVFLDP